MRRVMGVALIVLAASPAPAQQMNAEQFHRRASALKAKGPLALLQQDEIGALMKEGQAAGQAARNRRAADEKAGKPTRYCPPPGKVSMKSDEFMDGLSAIPQAQRKRIDMTEATTRILAAKFPCRR